MAGEDVLAPRVRIGESVSASVRPSFKSVQRNRLLPLTSQTIGGQIRTSGAKRIWNGIDLLLLPSSVLILPHRFWHSELGP